jgi:hypothetical protein
MRLINYSKVRRSAATDLKKYERLGVKMFTDALKLQAKPNPSPLPMQEAYVKFYQTVFVDSAKKEFDRIRQDNREKAYVPDDFFLNTWKEWIREWVLQNLGGLIKDVNDNTLKQIQEVLADGIEQGLNPFQLEKLLFEQIPNINRARAIARTESTRAYNEGKKKSAQDWANQTGTILWKLWIHGGSREPRIQHIQAQDKPIPANGFFDFITPKGEVVLMDKPGDINGGPSQTINCSCVVVYVSEAYARRNFPDAFTNNLPTPSQNILPSINSQTEFIPSEAKYSNLNQFSDKIYQTVKGNKFTWNEEIVNGEFETMQNAMAELQGFRGLPKVLSNEEFLRLSKDPRYTLIYRGVEGDTDKNISADQFINDYSKGSLYGSRKNMYGNGTYWASEDQYPVAFNYGGDKDENVFPALINKSEMKLGDFTTLYQKWEQEKLDRENELIRFYQNKNKAQELYSDEYRKNHPEDFEKMMIEMKMFAEFGSWATSQGYDGYTVKSRSMTFRQLGIETTDFVVTLNRTKTVVSQSLRGRL